MLFVNGVVTWFVNGIGTKFVTPGLKVDGGAAIGFFCDGDVPFSDWRTGSVCCRPLRKIKIPCSVAASMSKLLVPMRTDSDVTCGRLLPLAAPVGVRPSGCGIEVMGAANP